MAWISVHEQIDGSKLRELRKELECSKCEAIGILVKLWLWGINNANRFGEIPAADLSDIEEMFAGSLPENMPASRVSAALVSTGWIDISRKKLFIHDWKEWQKQWYDFLDKKEKDRARKAAEKAKDSPDISDGNSTEIPNKKDGESQATVTSTSTSTSTVTDTNSFFEKEKKEKETDEEADAERRIQAALQRAREEAEQKGAMPNG